MNSMGRMTLITAGERRRRWSDEERARILAAVETPGAVVAEVARREDMLILTVSRDIVWLEGRLGPSLRRAAIPAIDNVNGCKG